MILTRDALYELVSKTPLSKLAVEFDIPATKLAEICRSNNIPYPGSGYWTRKSLGQSVALTPLPDMGATPVQIDLEPLKRQPKPSTSATKKTPPVEQDRTNSSKSVTPARQHPIVAAWLADHERRTREAQRSRDPWMTRTAPPPLSELDHRRHAMLNDLFFELEKNGAKVTDGLKGMVRATIAGENIDFQLREKKRQVKTGRTIGSQTYPGIDLHGTGRLVFSIRTYLRGSYHEEWLETAKKPLEAILPEIVARLLEGADILKAWHVELREEQEQRRKQEEARLERLRLHREEQKRRAQLGQMAQSWTSAQQIRSMLAVMQARSLNLEEIVDGRPLRSWFEWAEETANALDCTQQGAKAMFSMLATIRET